jgi:hypothetical protein
VLALSAAVPSAAWAQATPAHPAPPAASAPSAASAAPDAKMVEVDPIRCWWKTSDGAVRVGQTFTLTLTCATLQNESVQVVPDETRLGAAVMQMAPFEIVRGDHPADLYSGERRFFQYEYLMRIINPDMIGKDVRIPDQIIHYRINSRVSQNAALQGKDNIYDLPYLDVRVLSVVPADAQDIRDSGNESFGIAQSLAFRASVFEIVAVSAAALGALFLLLSLIRLIIRTRKTKKVTGERGIGDVDVLRHVARELVEVQKESEGAGWSGELVDRALAATRVAAAVAVGRPIGQIRGRGGKAGEGRLLMTPWRRRAATISGGVTTTQVTRELNALPDMTSAARRKSLEDLQSSLSVFTAAQYARTPVFDREALDEAVSRAAAAASSLRSERTWPKPHIRRWTTRQAEA